MILFVHCAKIYVVTCKNSSYAITSFVKGSCMGGGFPCANFISLISCIIQSTSKKAKMVVKNIGKLWNRRAAEEAPIVKTAFRNHTTPPIITVLLNLLLYCQPFSN